MGLFRVLFALFYLWHISIFDVSIMSGMPGDYRESRILLVDLLSVSPSRATLRVLDTLLVAALVLLAFGIWTRAVTAVILVAGVFREAFPTVVNVEESNLFLVFYIPLFMLVAGRWGDTYSLDAMRGQRRGGAAVDPSDDAGSHFVAARAVLVILAILFMSSPVFKILGGGTWLAQRDLLANFMLERSVQSAAHGLAANPLAPWLSDHALVGYSLQLGVLAFEGLFFLALFGRRLRSLFVAMALLFHSVNALFMVVSFTPILIVYGLFVNWEDILRRVGLCRLRFPEASTSAWTALALLAATLLALLWHAGAAALFNLGGILNWRSMWFPVLPVALGWAAISAARIVRPTKPG
jgi:hypothetical protein